MKASRILEGLASDIAEISSSSFATYMYMYMHIHTYIHTYVHAYVHLCIDCLCRNFCRCRECQIPTFGFQACVFYTRSTFRIGVSWVCKRANPEAANTDATETMESVCARRAFTSCRTVVVVVVIAAAAAGVISSSM